MEGILPENVINYDETTLTNDPGKRRKIYQQETKYPERILNKTKSSTSRTSAGYASGEILPLYTVYKSEHLDRRRT